MKETEENLAGMEGFQEAGSEGSGSQSSTGKNRPDLRVVQAEVDREGKTIYRNVGGMWRNVSRNGNVFYTLMIGNMKLLVFENKNK